MAPTHRPPMPPDNTRNILNPFAKERLRIPTKNDADNMPVDTKKKQRKSMAIAITVPKPIRKSATQAAMRNK